MTEQDKVLDAYDALIKERDKLDGLYHTSIDVINSYRIERDTLARENERLREALTQIANDGFREVLERDEMYQIARAALANAPTPNDKG